MNQSFTRQELYRLCKQSEYVDFGLSANELNDLLSETFENIVNDNFEFNIKKVNEYYLTNDLPNKLVLRKLNDNLKRLYKDEQANRRIIISQIKTLLEESCPFWILKTDISSFYESINRSRIIEKFQNDSMLSYQSMYLLNKLFSNELLNDTTGVPRGLNISATLSEIYMRKFDKWIRRYEGVYYYARFVDDIIIFSNNEKSIESLKENMDLKLAELAEGLITNKSKTQSFDGSNIKPDKSLEYLGYKFIKKKSGKKVDLEISIADKKINKIKTRIVLCFLDYTKNKNFHLLEKRIKFLTGNYSIRKSMDGNDLRAGIYYNYLHVNNYNIFTELNTFYRKILYSRNKNFGEKLSISLTIEQKERLNKYCFKTGFLDKTYNSFTHDEMSNIIRCW